MIHFARGQKAKLTDLTSANTLQISLNLTDTAHRVFDVACFGVDDKNQLSDDRYFIFYNQTAAPEGSLAIIETLAHDLITFQVDFTRLPQTIRKLVFVASLDDAGNMSQVNEGYLRIMAQGNELGRFTFTGRDFLDEKAIIVAEIYWKDMWRFSAVGQGFKGGLRQLLEHFGGKEESPQQQIAPPPVPPPPRVEIPKPSLTIPEPPAGGKVILKKGESAKITLKKQEVVSQIRVKLTWTKGVDFDCHAFYKSKKGEFGQISYMNKGNLFQEPYIRLDKDAGVGNVAGQNEENIVISKLDYVEYVLIAVNIFRLFGFLSSGENFAKYDGKVLIQTDHGTAIEVPLTSEEKGKWCVIAKIDNTSSPKVENINRVYKNQPTLADFL